MATMQYIEQMKGAKKIAIIVHQNADTDALASAISLRRIIKDNFEKLDEKSKKEIDVFTDTAEFNKKDEDLIKNESINEQRYKRYDLAIALDTPNRARLGQYDTIFKKSKDTLNIDHHSTNVRFAKNNIVVPTCSSVCELLFLLFCANKKYVY
ncbi:MAG: DHH family phosphoesterase, partial [Clostridia bacterium]|nr:DHH family phosphoesterase [Clostridia bacterium]